MRPKANTFGELKASGYQQKTVKSEIRENLIPKLKTGETLFPEIIGYEDSVIPEICNALLSKHNFILLGLRGQAKSKMFRLLTHLLDEYIPVIKGSPLNESPFSPISKFSKEQIRKYGDQTEIEWLHRDRRYNEKLATPDVSMSDLIGDVDPIKAATRKLSFSDEEVIHFGIIPKTNRGIFAINELPDLSARIQVGLFNLLEENDIQVRGFPIRFPLDMLLVFSANPEDYTNRGSIITPLKDRIDSQILTHYPKKLEECMQITSQESWIERAGGIKVCIPLLFKRLLEQVTQEARLNKDYIDQGSGISVRMSISAMENFISNIERRALQNGEELAYPRISDLHYLVPSMTGKMELVYEGEQEGSLRVAEALIGLAVKKIFSKHFPSLDIQKSSQVPDDIVNPYAQVIHYFEEGNQLTIDTQCDFEAYYSTLVAVPGLSELTNRYFPMDDKGNPQELAAGMELVLEGLHMYSRLSKSKDRGGVEYRDMISTMMDGAVEA